MHLTRFLTVLFAVVASIAGASAQAQTPVPDGPLLTYAVRPSPEPLQVSAQGSLRVVVSKPGTDSVRLESLDFSIVIGTPARPVAASLTDTEGGIGLDSPDGWDFISLGNGSFHASPSPPATAVDITTQGLVFTISNFQVNPQVGTTTLVITERAAAGARVVQPRVAVVQLSKFPVSLTVGDLTASRPRVGFRETATLRWEGSDADYTIMYGDTVVSIRPQDRDWTTPPLEQTTTFILVARAQAGGSTVMNHLAITVQVDTPAVRANDLTVRDSSILRGPVQAMVDLRVGKDVRAGGRLFDSTGLVFPPGGIIMWSGSNEQVPQGWVLCDGGNGTPDLRGRFIVGLHPERGDYKTVGATGGAENVSLTERQMPAHTHGSSIAKAGEHSHLIEGTSANGLKWRRRENEGESTVDMDWGGGKHADPRDEQWRGFVPTSTTVAHSHTVAIAAAGGGQPHENRPPYYVLAYIMKL